MKTAFALILAAAGSALASPVAAVAAREDDWPRECLISAGATHHNLFKCNGEWVDAAEESQICKFLPYRRHQSSPSVSPRFEKKKG